MANVNMIADPKSLSAIWGRAGNLHFLQFDGQVLATLHKLGSFFRAEVNVSVDVPSIPGAKEAIKRWTVWIRQEVGISRMPASTVRTAQEIADDVGLAIFKHYVNPCLPFRAAEKALDANYRSIREHQLPALSEYEANQAKRLKEFWNAIMYQSTMEITRNRDDARNLQATAEAKEKEIEEYAKTAPRLICNVCNHTGLDRVFQKNGNVACPKCSSPNVSVRANAITA